MFSNFWDSYFSSYGEFGEFSLRFTAAVSAVAQRSLSGRCVYKESGSPSWTLDQPGTVTVGSGPRTLAGPR